MTMVTRVLAIAVVLMTGCTGGSTGSSNPDPNAPLGAATWSKSVGGPGDDWANTVIATRDGGYLMAGVLDHQQIAGTVSINPTEGDLWVAKLDTLGDTTWQQVIGERRSGSATAAVDFQRVRAGADGYWMVGTQTGPGASGNIAAGDAHLDLLVSRLNDDGGVRWSQTYDGGAFAPGDFFDANANSRDRGFDIAPTRDGGALVVAWTSAVLRVNATSGVPAAAPWILRLTSTGTIIWQRRLSETQSAYLADDPNELLIRESADGGAFIAASARLRGNDPDPAMQITRLGSGGELRWTRRYSRLIATSLLQVQEDNDGLSNDDIVIGGVDLSVRGIGGGPLEDQDTIVMNLHLADGTEDWRRVIEVGVSIRAVRQICRPALPPSYVTYACKYFAAGSGRRGDAGPTIGMLSLITDNGDLDGNTFYDDALAATGVALYPSNPVTPDSPLVITGIRSEQSADPQPGLTGFAILGTPASGAQFERRTEIFFPADPRSLTLDASAQFEPLADGRLLVSAAAGGGRGVRVLDVNRQTLLERAYGGASERSGERAFHALEVTGGFIVIGQADGASSNAARPGTLIAKLSETGAVLWQRTLDDVVLPSYGQAPYQALASNGTDGFVVVANYWPVSATADPDDIRLFSFDATGALQRMSGTLKVSTTVAALLGSTLHSYPTSLRRAADGTYFVAGHTSGGPYETNSDSWVSHVDALGAPLWSQYLFGDAARVNSMRVLPDGGIVVAGVAGLFSRPAPWAARLDSAGAITWSRTYAVRTADSMPVSRIALASDGGFLLATSHELTNEFASNAEQANAGARNALLIRIDSSGNARWHRTYGGLLDETIFSLDSTSDGGFVMAGRSDSLGERGEAWIVRVGGDGLVSEGCSALLTAELATNDAPLGLTSATYEPVPIPAGALPLSRTSNLPTHAPAATVLARQCAGVARADGATSGARFRLTMIQGNTIEPGVVISAPAGIACSTGSNLCTASFTPDTSVALRVDPGSVGRFIDWQGCDVASGDQCIVNMTADRSVTANFRSVNVPLLSVGVIGNGTISGGGLSCRYGTGTCTATYSAGQVVTLSTAADLTENFIGWGGACGVFGAAQTIQLTLDANRNCSAQFTGGPPGSPVISVNIAPTSPGAVYGTVRSTPAGLNCGFSGTDCAQSFASGTIVSLTANSRPTTGYTFESFICPSESLQIGARTLQIEARQDEVCTAQYAADIERLSVRLVGPDQDPNSGYGPNVVQIGRVWSESAGSLRGLDCVFDCDRPFTRGQSVILRAAHGNRTFFGGWDGCDAVGADPLGGVNTVCYVSMTRARSVAAFFPEFFVVGGNTNKGLGISFPIDSGAGAVRVQQQPNAAPCAPSGGNCEFFFQTNAMAILTIEPVGNNAIASHDGCDTFVPATGAMPAECRVTLSRHRLVTIGFTDVNAPPQPVISRTPAGAVAVNQTIQFSGAGTTDDQDPQPLNYQWDFDNNGSVDSQALSPTYAYSSEGTYTVRLRVTDLQGAAGETTTSVVVTSANRPPVASFTYAPANPTVGQTVMFDASGSTDDSSVARYRWDFDNDGTFEDVGDTRLARNVQFTYLVAGTFTVRLSVVDDAGLVNETTRNVTVAGASSGNATLTLTLTGGGHGVVEYTPIVTACSKDSEPVCVREFANLSTVVLKATAYSGSSLGNWGTGCQSINPAGDECRIFMDGNRTMTLGIN